MNKLIMVLGALLVMLIAMFIFNGGDDKGDAAVTNTAQSKAPTTANGVKGDAANVTTEERDDYVNTLKTISARSIEQEKRITELNLQLEQQKKEGVTKKEVEEIAAKTTEDRANDFSATLTDKIDALSKRFGEKNPNGDMPNGLGFDNFLNLPGGAKEPGMDSPDKRRGTDEYFPGADEQYVTIKPISSITSIIGTNGQVGAMMTPDGRPIVANDFPIGTGASVIAPGGSGSGTSASIPMYTIPQNATLFHNSGMTALVGVVPNNENSVLDPIRFKLITGPENIATNGLYLSPGVKDIVWSGIAIGNREMSCTRGELHSVTFTFEDGTIQTINAQADSGRDRLGGSLLGYIATQRGNPCIPGQLITNAQQYLSDRMWASGFASAADAFAQTQQTTLITPDGGAVQTISGDTGSFIAGQTLTGSMQELVEYLRARQAGAVDLVFVASGQDLVVHVEKEIAIDYNPNGRKLSHANKIPQSAAVAGLD